MKHQQVIAISAQAGIHAATRRITDKWIPACAGTTVRFRTDMAKSSPSAPRCAGIQDHKGIAISLPRHDGERGNALFLILIAVALFAALSYAITQSSRGGGGIDREQAAIEASRIVQYASMMSNAVQRLKLINGCSDADISFESVETGTVYENPASGTSCDIFSADGGGLGYQAPNADILDSSNAGEPLYGDFHFTGMASVLGVGNEYTCGDPAGKDLIMILPYLKEDVCREIAKNTTGLYSDGRIPQDFNIFFDTRPAGLASRFTGAYIDACGFDLSALGQSGFLLGKTTGCIEGDVLPPAGTYHFYHVLIAR